LVAVTGLEGAVNFALQPGGGKQVRERSWVHASICRQPAGQETVDREMIEQSFARAGWQLDDSFSEYLVIGHNGDGLSILAYPEAGITEEDPVFELIDHERYLTYGVQEILTPPQAARLLQEHGLPPEEDSDDPL